MRSELTTLLPSDKSDTEKVKAIVALGFPAVEPILPALLEWMQDINWPVAQALQPFLASIGAPLAPHIRSVLNTDDDVWKNWVLRYIVVKSPELQTMLRADIERLATRPTRGEQAEELDVLAGQIVG
jgi:hypothetical protein